MEKVSKSKVNDHLNDRIGNVLNTFFNDEAIKIKLTGMTHDYISLTVENSQITKFIDIFFTLTQNENIEIIYLDIRFIEGVNYINYDMNLWKKS
ncbi:TPA: hypothetical protein PXS19_002736 [Yersinia enterocolitica]|nr:hypothetical protein [Yersinia enterocolitica]HDL7614150.1 hypothetical protein [Yersinia enterocolitica]HDL7642123.1 hypothetical protein [Yersinia enterocolitica]HDL7771056.1 hypothetical protein [Yersinia enterocolitica]HDL7775195.1 hypothetical protein [Yersinia enterocolitica]